MSQKEHESRRRQLLRMLGKQSIAIIPSAKTSLRNRDVEHAFRQDSDFFYLTGFDEPDAVAVLIPGRPKGEYLLFCREYDEHTALWTGDIAGLDGARQTYLAHDAFPIEDMDDILPDLMENRSRVYFPMGRDPEFDQHVIDWAQQVRTQVRRGVSAPAEFISLDHLLHEMRLIKSKAEIRRMKKAADISAKAHTRAMQTCRPGLYEYQIESELNHEFMQHGARHSAYPAIVGGGKNACVLHYTRNSDVLEDGDLLLIDAGCEWEYYASDITRTFPVNGRFNAAQRALYQLVLDAQLAAIEQVKPGNHWNDPHDAAVKCLTKGLVKLGLLQGRVPSLIKNESYREFYMHRTGHWLGMDVHDVGEYQIDRHWRLLEPGMVLTVEPGLYIAPGTPGVDKKWQGIGIRIEDDVLVTADGHEVLSKDVPKQINEIEALMRQRDAA